MSEEITIVVPWGSEAINQLIRVRAIKRGELAVHRTLEGRIGQPFGQPALGETWSVTHTRTGRCFPVFENKYEALAFTAFAKDLPWDFDNWSVADDSIRSEIRARWEAFQELSKEEKQRYAKRRA